MNKTYKELKSEYRSNEKMMEVYNALHRCGISLKNVHFYNTPTVYSDYSMGEMVYIYCNDVLIEKVNNCREYAKSCKWKAKHGRVEVRFTKKALKEYIDLRKSILFKENHNDILALIDKKRDLVTKYVNLNNSVVKNLFVF